MPTSENVQAGDRPQTGLRTSHLGRAFIAAREGVVLKAYPDPGTGSAPWTIGIGHTSAAGPPVVSRGMTISRADAFAVLSRDLARFEATVRASVRVALAQHEFDALVSLAFNIGGPALAASHLVRLLNAGDRAGAGEAFLSWSKANGRVLPGLVSRRRAERRLFLQGDYAGVTDETRPAPS